MITFKKVKTIHKSIVEGATVIIKHRLIPMRRYSGIYFNHTMKKYCGKQSKVINKSINPHGDGYMYQLVIDDGEWSWHESMLELVK